MLDAQQAGADDGPAPRKWRLRAALLAVVIFWLAVAGVAGPLSGKISQAQKNDNASFLPPKAESTEVNNEQQKFTGSSSVPFIVVWTKQDGSKLDQSDFAAIGQQVAAIHADQRIQPYVTGYVPTPGQPLVPGGPVLPAVPSADGMAAQLIVNFDAKKIATVLPDGTQPITAVADDLRKLTSTAPALKSYVTGPGGIFADLFGAFSGIDTKLLAVTVLVVAIILIIVYRSPVLWLIPLLGAGLSLVTAQAVVYLLATHDILTLDGQTQGILTVLVFGAGTDYALLLIARYREELHLHARSWHAMKVAYRGAGEAILASGGTVIAGLLCLLLSELNNNRSLGPVAAIGIMCALAVMLTFLPAVLLLLGRWPFWPFVPRFDSEPRLERGIWGRISGLVGRKPRMIWLAMTGVLLILMTGLFSLKADGITYAQNFTTQQESIKGLTVLDEHYPAGTGSPAEVISNASEADAVLAATKSSPGVAAAGYFNGTQVPGATPKVVDGRVMILATLAYSADSKEAQQAIVTLRQNVHAVPDADAIVGGNSAINLDVATAAKHDRNLIIPLVLAVIFVILALLLRAFVAPLLLIVTVLMSYLATLGACGYVFTHVFHFAGADTSFPLFAFIFLVALGIDYNIFLMTRVREESAKIGTRPGTRKALAVTGGVITSAGVVLAATFSVLGVLPLVVLAQVGFAVAFGVLLDTFVVRSFLVPALVTDIGSRIWIPGRLAKQVDVPIGSEPEATEPVAAS